MKWLATLLIAVALVSCSNPETDRLREENAQLKTQLQVVTQERDAMKTQLESVRAALGQGSSAMPSSGMASSDPTSNNSSPSTTNPSDSTSGSTPSSDGSSSTSSSSTGSGDTTSTPPSGPQASPGVIAYAQSVLRLAATYGAETGTPPTDCTKGYEAGSSRLALGDGLALKSCVVEMVNDQLRVSLETSDGAKLSVPSNGP